MARPVVQIDPQPSPVVRPPGFLLSPFGWVSERLIALLERKPALLVELICLSRTRMHLIALALAHVEGDIPEVLGQVLFRGSAGDILDAAIGRRLVGLKRVVQCLPHCVLGPESYRRLVQLLDDPAAAKLLYHAVEIDDSAIKIIDDIPIALRAVVFTMRAWFRGMDSLGDGLRYLVRRGGAPNFDALIADLAHVRQPEQLIAKIKSIVEALPLPNALPPVQVGPARRLDHAADLRNLAKRWRNCLESYVWRVDGGECAIYLWEQDGVQAACAVGRRARLGWFLDEVKGPRNAEIEPPHLDTIRNAFDSAGMPPHSIVRAVEDIVDMAGMRGLPPASAPPHPARPPAGRRSIAGRGVSIDVAHRDPTIPVSAHQSCQTLEKQLRLGMSVHETPLLSRSPSARILERCRPRNRPALVPGLRENKIKARACI